MDEWKLIKKIKLRYGENPGQVAYLINKNNESIFNFIKRFIRGIKRLDWLNCKVWK